VLALESVSSSTLFESDSTTWSLVPGLRWNIFNGGRVRSQVQVEEARTEQALRFYEQAVLLALEEVENSLVAYEREKVRRTRLQEAVDATERTVELVRTQYLSGLTDFQSYLDAQRSLINQQDSLAASEGQVVLNLISLNRALGGGWTEPDPEMHPMDVASEIYQTEDQSEDSSEGNP
jgi:outer membrane protein TolC